MANRDLTTSRPCPWCGKTLPAVFNFCIYCGKQIDEQDGQQEPDGLEVSTDELEELAAIEPIEPDESTRSAPTGECTEPDDVEEAHPYDLGEAAEECDDDADAQTTIFEDDADSATTVLDSGPMLTLRRMATGEVYDILTPCVLGKGTRATVQIFGNSAISRQHAKIDYSGRDLTIEDLGSTNGTEVNGRQLAPGTRRVIKDGDNLRIADELFTVSFG